MALFEAGQPIYASILDGTHALRMSGTGGERTPSAAVLAQLPVESIRQLLGPEQYPTGTARTPTTWETLALEIERLRRAAGPASATKSAILARSAPAPAVVDGTGHPCLRSGGPRRAPSGPAIAEAVAAAALRGHQPPPRRRSRRRQAT